MPTRSRLMLVLALIAGPACGPPRPRAAPVQRPADVTLQVTNHHYLDVTVFVIHDGQRTRIGQVTGSSAQTFTLSPRMIGQSHELALVGEAVGSDETARTERLIVHPGQLIEWTLESRLRRSSVGVY